MNLNKKQIGRIEVWFGIILLISTFIGTYWGMNYFYELINIGSYNVGGSWGEAQTEPINLNIYAESMSSLSILAEIYQTARVLLGFMAVILAVLSLILILQGLINQK